MKLTNENVLIASLLGANIVQKLPRFAAVQNELAKHVLPPVNFLPVDVQQEEITSAQGDTRAILWQNDPEKIPEDQFFPFSFLLGKDYYTLPWEPMITLEAKNIIAKRYIAKAGKNYIGSIKERWSTDDYEITITGAMYGKDLLGKPKQAYPRIEMEKLRDILLAPSAIEIKCELLEIHGINKIVIESMSFPFTKGENVQAYEIKAVSDFSYDLLYQKKRNYILEVGKVEFLGFE